MSHLTDEQLSALLDGALAGEARSTAERHLEGCGACRESLAALAAQDRALASSVEQDPGDAYFESFAGRVGGRIRAAGLKGAQARENEGRGLAEWFHSPRKLALVGAIATVVAGAGIVMLASREVRVPALREQALERRVAQQAPPPQAPGPSSAQPAPGVRALPLTVAAPLAGALRDRAVSRDKENVTSSDELAAPVPPARTPSNRAYEVRRNAAGEDVPVRKAGEYLYMPPRTEPAPAPAVPGQPVHARKPQYAEPLGAEKRADDARGGARPAPAKAGNAAAPLAPSATGAAMKATAREESSADAMPRFGSAIVSREQAASGLAQGLADRGLALQVRGTPEAFAGLPPGPRARAQNAQRLTTLAEASGLAPAWDAAAAGWERAVEGVQGGPLESEARFQAARARFMAWQRAGSGGRASKAAQALDGFLVHAPRGFERDSAQTWLARLKK